MLSDGPVPDARGAWNSIIFHFLLNFRTLETQVKTGPLVAAARTPHPRHRSAHSSPKRIHARLPFLLRVESLHKKIIGKGKGNSIYCTEEASSGGRGGWVPAAGCGCREEEFPEQGAGPGGQRRLAAAGSTRGPLVGSAGRRAKGPEDNTSALRARRRLCFWVLTVLRPRKCFPDAGRDGSCTCDKTMTVPRRRPRPRSRPLAAALCGGHTCS